MPGRKFNTNAYRYGLNGQEMDNELNSIDGAYTSAEYWQYDARLGRRWNVDPLFNKYPEQSSYSTFNNNPTLYEDPIGESGIASIDKKTKTITVKSNFIIYGGAANKFLAATTAKDIQRIWNAAAGKVVIDGIEYAVKFEITGEYRDKDDASLVREIVNNGDYKNNYYRVEYTTDSYGGDNTSYDDYGGNTGYFKYSDIKSNYSTTEGHEYGHGLGLGHNSPDGLKPIVGQPDIMDTRNNPAEKKYALYDGTLDINTRVVSQKNIQDVFTKEIKEQLKLSGTANIGILSNEYHFYGTRDKPNYSDLYKEKVRDTQRPKKYGGCKCPQNDK
jgi:hypothetical protein